MEKRGTVETLLRPLTLSNAWGRGAAVLGSVDVARAYDYFYGIVCDDDEAVVRWRLL